MANVELAQKMIPSVTCEISLSQYVCELVFRVNVFHLDFGVQIDSVEQPVKSNSVGSLHVSHRWTSSVILIATSLSSKNVQLRLYLTRMCVGG